MNIIFTEREMSSCGVKLQKISFYRVLVWSSALFVLGESFNHGYTALPKRSEIEEESWRCLVSLDDSKFCDCFSDCPGDADEAFCHSRVSRDRVASPSSYQKCCSLLAEDEDLATTNISPQAFKFCQAQAPNNEFPHFFERPNVAVYREAEPHFQNNGAANDKIIYAVKRIWKTKAKRDGFDCDENKRQIPFNYVCDGEPDCLDGSDENDTLCSMMG